MLTDLDINSEATVDLNAFMSKLAARTLDSCTTSAANTGSLNIDPDRVGQDLAKLVLTLIEFVRQLLEAQAIRRMEAGSLTEEQEEQLGSTLFNAREKIIELAEAFGIEPEDLTANLGPLGKLI